MLSKMRMTKFLVAIFVTLFLHQAGFGQVNDTVPPFRVDTVNVPTDTLPVFKDSGKKGHSPRQATIRSAILPGLGQIYNRKYWKVPIVYAAIGTPAYLFFYNKQWYNRTRYALSIVANDRYTGAAAADSLEKVHPQLRGLVNQKRLGSLTNYRNEFRRDMDYSILFVALMWGLNVVDATVDGHLRGFDVSDDLSMKIKPAFLPGTFTPGISLVVNFK